MAITSIVELLELHRKLRDNVRGRGREGDAEGEGEDARARRGAEAIEALQRRGERELRGSLEATLERLRQERDRLVADYDDRLRAIQTELADLGGGAPANAADEPPRPHRPKRAAKRKRGDNG